jgi:hypothetical protein
VKCATDSTCDITDCAGEVTTCADGSKVCRQSCPGDSGDAGRVRRDGGAPGDAGGQ